jgi:hypothetical protein
MLPDGHIVRRCVESGAARLGDIEVRARHRARGWESDAAEPELDTIEAFPGLIKTILEEHRPSRMPFFARLAAN